MSSEQVERILNLYIHEELNLTEPGLPFETYYCEMCDSGLGASRDTVPHGPDCIVGALEASQRENERLRHYAQALEQRWGEDEVVDLRREFVIIPKRAALEEGTQDD